MSTYRIIRHITEFRTAGYACTIMAIREDTAGKNECLTRLCADRTEAERAARLLEDQLRNQVRSRGDAIVDSRELAAA